MHSRGSLVVSNYPENELIFPHSPRDNVKSGNSSYAQVSFYVVCRPTSGKVSVLSCYSHLYCQLHILEHQNSQVCFGPPPKKNYRSPFCSHKNCKGLYCSFQNCQLRFGCNIKTARHFFASTQNSYQSYVLIFYHSMKFCITATILSVPKHQ